MIITITHNWLFDRSSIKERAILASSEDILRTNKYFNRHIMNQQEQKSLTNSIGIIIRRYLDSPMMANSPQWVPTHASLSF